MNKYVKIEGYTEWFLFIAKEEDLPENQGEIGAERLKQNVLAEMYDTDIDPLMWAARIQTAVSTPKVDYAGTLRRYQKPILIRENGSYMMCSSVKDITETFYGVDYPHTRADIVVCENAATAPTDWIDFLKKKFPNKSIQVISYFRTRTTEYLEEIFKHKPIITFSTTFTDYAWFELLCRSIVHEDTEIIGVCPSADGIDGALNLIELHGVPGNWTLKNFIEDLENTI